MNLGKELVQRCGKDVTIQDVFPKFNQRNSGCDFYATIKLGLGITVQPCVTNRERSEKDLFAPGDKVKYLPLFGLYRPKQ